MNPCLLVNLIFQLSQVQGTINNLQESLFQEQNQVMGTGSIQYPQLVPPLLPDIPLPSVTPTAVPHVAGIGIPTSGVQAPTPMSTYAGLGSLAMGSQGKNLITVDTVCDISNKTDIIMFIGNMNSIVKPAN